MIQNSDDKWKLGLSERNHTCYYTDLTFNATQTSHPLTLICSLPKCWFLHSKQTAHSFVCLTAVLHFRMQHWTLWTTCWFLIYLGWQTSQTLPHLSLIHWTSRSVSTIYVQLILCLNVSTPLCLRLKTLDCTWPHLQRSWGTSTLVTPLSTHLPCCHISRVPTPTLGSGWTPSRPPGSDLSTP